MDGWILIIFVKNMIKTNKKKPHTDDVEVSKNSCFKYDTLGIKGLKDSFFSSY